jgi:hypothetical protein
MGNDWGQKMLDSAQSAARPPQIRSAQTNDPLLVRGVDGRSVVARRYRDIACALASELGGQDQLSEPAKLLIRQAAALTVQVEQVQAKIVAGEDVDLEQLTRLSNSSLRTLQRLGIKKPPGKPGRPASRLDAMLDGAA